MFEEWDRELREKLTKHKSRKGDILGKVSMTTLEELSHNMQIEGKVLKSLYLDLQDEERADLEDYLRIEKEYGRTD